MLALEHMPDGLACKKPGHSEFQCVERNALESGGIQRSRALLIGVIILEFIALIVLDAPQRARVHLVQDHA